MAGLSIKLLGIFQVSLDHLALDGFETMKTRALLAYLAEQAGQDVPRSTLAGLLWPEHPQSAALNNLRQTLSSLRRVIRDAQARPPYLAISRETIGFNLHSDFTIDTLDFLSLAGTRPGLPDLESLEQAAALYRGDFLEGLALRDSPPFEEWILARREKYRSRILEVLYDLTESYLVGKRFERAIACARRQIEIEPWLEEAHQQLMLVLASAGRRSEALAQYETCRQLLHAELGVEPAQATRLLFERIRGGETTFYPTQAGIVELPASPRRSHNLPRPLTSLIGREQEVQVVQRLLEEHSLVTLSGAGGVGKSRLALAAAAGLVESYADGVWLAELAPLDDPTQVISAVTHSLGLSERPVQPTLAGLNAYLSARELLLVLDNCEHLVDACAALVQDLLQSCPRLRILATSREKLGLPGEIVYRVPSLPFPDPEHPLPLPKARDYPALRLFSERARAVQPAFQFNSNNLPAVMTLCQRLDGIPLAIELAASRLDVLTAEQLAARLDSSFSLLTGGARTVLPRHQTLRATLDWSYQLLSLKERLLLERLAVFAGGWTLEAAEAVCAGEGIPPGEVLGLLAGLVSKSMVSPDNRDAAENELHFRMLETMRQYAYDKLGARGGESTLLQRHAAYFVNLAQQAEPNLRRVNQTIWLDRMEHDLDNMRLAMSRMLNMDVSGELQLAIALVQFWHNRGGWDEGLAWINKGLQRIGLKDDDLRGNNPPLAAGISSAIRAKALEAAGYLHGKIPANLDNAAELETASNLLKESLSIYQKLRPEDFSGMATVLLQLARYSKESDRPVQMFSWANQSLDLFRKAGDEFGISECIAFQATMGRNSTLAEKQLHEALRLKKKIGDVDGIAHLYGYLSDLEIFKGSYTQAYEHILESIDNFGQINNRSYQIRCLGRLSWLNWVIGKTDQAFDNIQKALSSSLENETQQRSNFLLMRANIHLSMGQLQEANQDLNAGLHVAKDIPYSLPKVSAVIFQARLTWIEGDAAGALNILEKAIDLTHEIRGPNLKAEALYYSGRINNQQGNLPTAKKFLIESLKKYAGLWLWIDKLSIAYPLEGLAGLAISENNPVRATKLFGAAHRRFSQLDHTLSPFENGIRKRDIEHLKRTLGEAVFTQHWQEGEHQSFDQAVTYALAPE